MKLIVGLGNPGKQYSETRHNLGRSLVEHIAASRKKNFSKEKSLFVSIASMEWEGQSVVLACPEIFMNLSGQAVAALTRHFSINPQEDLLVVLDDAALSLGRIRLRSRGSDGGHNGLKSINEALSSSSYPRLRLGIGAPSAEPSLEAYVLSPFDSDEKKVLTSVMEKGLEACRLWISQPISSAMNIINSNTG